MWRPVAMKHWAILTGSGTSDLKEIDFCTSLDRVTLTPVKMTHAMEMESAEIWYVIKCFGDHIL